MITGRGSDATEPSFGRPARHQDSVPVIVMARCRCKTDCDSGVRRSVLGRAPGRFAYHSTTVLAAASTARVGNTGVVAPALARSTTVDADAVQRSTLSRAGTNCRRSGEAREMHHEPPVPELVGRDRDRSSLGSLGATTMVLAVNRPPLVSIAAAAPTITAGVDTSVSPQWLYVMEATGGSGADGTFTLRGVNLDAISFTDRPARLVRRIPWTPWMSACRLPLQRRSTERVAGVRS